MSQREKANQLPGWLWFFLILPIGLVVAILYRQRRQIPWVQQFADEVTARMPLPRARYIEPDSIPLDMDTEPHMDAEELAMQMMASEQGTSAPEAAAVIGGATSVAEAAASALDVEKASVAAGSTDDLKMVEGIGPAIAALLRENGILRFRQLADTSVEHLDEILTQAHLRSLADPTTWPEQSALAAEKKWDQLETLQRTLKAGRRKDNV